MRIVLWMFLLSLMNFYIFSFNSINLSDRLDFSIGLTFAIVAFQFIISDQIPNLPYLTIIDKYNLSVFSFILINSLISVIIGWKDSSLIELLFINNNNNNNDYTDDELNEKIKKKANDIDYIFFIILVIIYILFHILFTLYVIKKKNYENNKIGKSFINTHKNGLKIEAYPGNKLKKIGVMY